MAVGVVLTLELAAAMAAVVVESEAMAGIGILKLVVLVEPRPGVWNASLCR